MTNQSISIINEPFAIICLGFLFLVYTTIYIFHKFLTTAHTKHEKLSCNSHSQRTNYDRWTQARSTVHHTWTHINRQSLSNTKQDFVHSKCINTEDSVSPVLSNNSICLVLLYLYLFARLHLLKI